jgi:circadian clock protein KaiB
MMIFRLYIADNAPNSVRAIHNLQAICREYMPDAFEIDIVDVLDDPMQALTENVLVTPMLIRLSPAPTLRIIGDLSETRQVLLALGLDEKQE